MLATALSLSLPAYRATFILLTALVVACRVPPAGALPQRRDRWRHRNPAQRLAMLTIGSTPAGASLLRENRIGEDRRGAPEKSAARCLSILVLPFANIGGDPKQAAVLRKRDAGE